MATTRVGHCGCPSIRAVLAMRQEGGGFVFGDGGGVDGDGWL